MKRFHVHLGVTDIAQSIDFYSGLFGTTPSLVKDDYAKWMLDNPQVNFAISMRDNGVKGIQHVGLQVDNEAELNQVYERLHNTNQPVVEQGETNCCYAQSEKSWIADPDGVLWEAFLTNGESTIYGEDLDPRDLPPSSSPSTPPNTRPKPASSRCC